MTNANRLSIQQNYIPAWCVSGFTLADLTYLNVWIFEAGSHSVQIIDDYVFLIALRLMFGRYSQEIPYISTYMDDIKSITIWVPFLLTWFNLNPAWISNHIHNGVWEEIIYP